MIAKTKWNNDMPSILTNIYARQRAAAISTVISIACFSCSAFAQSLAPDERPQFHLPAAALASPNTENAQASNSQRHFTSQELLAHPDLLTQALDSAITLEDEAALALLLPLYAQLTEKDEILYRYGQAMLARLQGNMSQAIDLYRSILAERPDLAPVRLQLALALIADRQLEAGDAQLSKLSGEDLPSEIREGIKQLQAGIAKQQEWQFSFNAHGIIDRNINDSPSQRQVGSWTFAAPQTAYGLAYTLSANKLWALDNHWHIAAQLSAHGKSFWEKHEYDDVLLRASTGAVWKDGSKEWGMLPFHERRFYGSDSYSYSNGLRLQAAWQLARQWKWFGNYEVADNRYFSREHLNGKSQRLSNTLLYRPNAQQYWTFGIDVGREDAKDKSSAYDYYGLRLGLGKEWQQGISTAAQFYVLHQDYQEKDFTQIMRQDDRYGASLSLWKRDWHWQDFSPRLVWQWKRQKSNHFAYDQQAEQSVFVEISKDF